MPQPNGPRANKTHGRLRHTLTNTASKQDVHKAQSPGGTTPRASANSDHPVKGIAKEFGWTDAQYRALRVLMARKRLDRPKADAGQMQKLAAMVADNYGDPQTALRHDIKEGFI